MGWEPGESTTFEYDDEGRLIRAITVREPEFSHLDRTWMIESRRRDSEPRGRHGWSMSEATDPANRSKFYVPPPAVDFAAKAEVEARESAQKVYKDKFPMDALVFRVEKKP